MSYETYSKVKILGKGSFGKAFLVKADKDEVSWLIEGPLCNQIDRHGRDESWRTIRMLLRSENYEEVGSPKYCEILRGLLNKNA